jgi:predicted unusual protein kinase regulating ubiquinone biosynthesis (AarF/ABC1/UbiB family)
MTEQIERSESHVDIDRARYRTITTFFARAILHIILWDLILKRIIPGRVMDSRSVRWRKISRRFRLLAIDMGGVLIKLGQFLSARVDILPPEITEELQGLQDEVPAESAEAILAVLEAELDDLPARFAEIERQPLAAASLGQVHRAWLREQQPGSETGIPVVIKVQRPGIGRTVQTDLAALRVVARWVQLYRPIGRRADVPALMDEFARTLWQELDYVAEAEHGARFAEIFAGDPNVYIPYFYRRHCTGRVLVLEYVGGFKITDVESITQAGIDTKKVATKLLDTYFLQFFEEGFFHADPHPGNLFVFPRNDLSWNGESGDRPFSLAFVDFGMVGQLDSSLKNNLRRWIVAVLQKDAQTLTEVYRDMGFFLPSADLERITDAQRILLDHLWGRDLMDLAQPDPREVEELGREFRDILFDFPFQVPQDFVYLGRAIGILSGLASMLDPTINPWYYIERYGRGLIEREEIQKAGWELVLDWFRPLVGLPGRLDRTLSMVEEGRLQVQTSPDKETRRRMEKMEKQVNRLQWAVLGAAGLVSATLLYIFRRDKE